MLACHPLGGLITTKRVTLENSGMTPLEDLPVMITEHGVFAKGCFKPAWHIAMYAALLSTFPTWAPRVVRCNICHLQTSSMPKIVIRFQRFVPYCSVQYILQKNPEEIDCSELQGSGSSTKRVWRLRPDIALGNWAPRPDSAAIRIKRRVALTRSK